MKKVIARAPVRADLAGGTLDLWPLYLFHPGSRTVNVAISYYAESEVVEIGDSAIEIHLTDQQYEQRYESLQQLAADPKAALISRVLEHFHHINGVRITTRTDAPRGSGLGGSSALTITLVRALTELSGEPVEGERLVELVRDLETRLLGVPAGIQDYYPAVFGGLAALHLNPGAVIRNPIPLPVGELAEHMLLHYTGIAHFSGTNNWQLYKRHVDGKKKVMQGFDRIATNAMEMEKALESGNLEAAGAALAQEWKNRKALIEGISTPEIDAAIDAGAKAGAWGGKVCGAGGGGCIVFLAPRDKRDAVRRALAAMPGRVLDAVPVAHGLTVERSDDDTTQATFAFARARRARHGESLEQLWVYGGHGDYRPYLLAEAIVTHSEPRSGAHLSILRSYVAPINPNDGSVAWYNARPLDPDSLDIRAVPDPNRRATASVSPEMLTQEAAQSEEAFRQFLASTEKLRLLHNGEFGFYSEPNESRESFLARCLEEARRRVDDEAERLEGTFRRRLDQVKERSERDQREIDKDDTVPKNMSNEVNLAWGQRLYNITSGKPAAVAEASQTPREGDYLAKIAMIQKAWDRELEGIREDLESKANEIEEIVVAPAGKNIEITRYLILWGAGLL
jgi:D-glycero-alpha-D-manno-heptose-7-phosphate kinase